MKDRRIAFELLELYDWQGVERRLERQAAKGWRLEKIVSPLWYYRRTKPAQVRYAVTYLPNVGEATPRPDPEAQALDAVCTAAGWEKICDWNGMQIFSNEQPDPLPLETDERLRLQAIHQTLKRQWMGLMVLLAVLIFLLLLFCWGGQASGPTQYIWRAMLCCGVLYPVSELGLYGLWYLRARRAVERGEKCPSNHALTLISNGFCAAVIALFVLFLVVTLLEGPPGSGGRVVYMLLYMLGYMAIVWCISRLRIELRERGFSAAANWGLVILLAFVLFFVLQMLLTQFVLYA